MMSSEARYASTRLAKFPADGLVAVAQALLEETNDFGLREATHRIAERETPPVSDLTRRRLLGVLVVLRADLATAVDEASQVIIDDCPCCAIERQRQGSTSANRLE